jgi:hypothetical protein
MVMASGVNGCARIHMHGGRLGLLGPVGFMDVGPTASSEFLMLSASAWLAASWLVTG